MKARLLRYQGAMHLLLYTGVIRTVTEQEAFEFLLNFQDSELYSAGAGWDFEDLTIESFRGETIAYVSDDDMLCVIDASCFRTIMSQPGEKLLTVPQYAALHGKQSAIVRRMCLNGRIPGAIQRGTRWLIPESSPYPPEGRAPRKKTE